MVTSLYKDMLVSFLFCFILLDYSETMPVALKANYSNRVKSSNIAFHKMFLRDAPVNAETQQLCSIKSCPQIKFKY